MYNVLTAVNMTIMVFQDVTPCSFREMYSTTDEPLATLFWPVFYSHLKIFFRNFGTCLQNYMASRSVRP